MTCCSCCFVLEHGDAALRVNHFIFLSFVFDLIGSPTERVGSQLLLLLRSLCIFWANGGNFLRMIPLGLAQSRDMDGRGV